MFRIETIARALCAILVLVVHVSTAVARIGLDTATLSREIAERTQRVPEFEFIRQEGERLGLRVYLFGGTAASFAHYVHDDLKLEGGDTSFQKEHFDYDFTNIFRSTQDLDIVVDGPVHKAEAFEELIRGKYPNFLGARTAWEVRLLREARGTKEAILGNPDFMNQHTDSNSTGLIEVTRTQNEEPSVRDARDWESRIPQFLKDVHENKIHYYFSPLHSQTTRFKKGENPPIFSAIRALTKVFQYNLQIRDEEMATIKKIIDEFSARDLTTAAARDWIERNGKKLFQHAVNLESAWNTLESLGLRKKLIALTNDITTQDSLAWWMNKEPLRSKAFGTTGRAAKGLGITEVAHETHSFLAYESITRSHQGFPNVFISRKNAEGEAAISGDGFYTLIGKKGARGTKINIRFTLHPDAREGIDFKRDGEVVIVLNKNALTVIPESLDFDPIQYIEFLRGDIHVENQDNLAIVEKFRRRLKHKIVNLAPEEKKRLREIWDEEILAARKVPAAAMIELFPMIVDTVTPTEYVSLLRKASETGEHGAAIFSALSRNFQKSTHFLKSPEVRTALQRFYRDDTHHDAGIAQEIIQLPVTSLTYAIISEMIRLRSEEHMRNIWHSSRIENFLNQVDPNITPSVVDDVLAIIKALRSSGTETQAQIVRSIAKPEWMKHPRWNEVITALLENPSRNGIYALAEEMGKSSPGQQQWRRIIDNPLFRKDLQLAFTNKLDGTRRDIPTMFHEFFNGFVNLQWHPDIQKMDLRGKEFHMSTTAAQLIQWAGYDPDQRPEQKEALRFLEREDVKEILLRELRISNGASSFFKAPLFHHVSYANAALDVYFQNPYASKSVPMLFPFWNEKFRLSKHNYTVDRNGCKTYVTGVTN